VTAAAVVVVVVAGCDDPGRAAADEAGTLAWKPGKKVAEAGTGTPDTSWPRTDGADGRKWAESAKGTADWAQCRRPFRRTRRSDRRWAWPTGADRVRAWPDTTARLEKSISRRCR
jgi:hypothetical protein